MKFRRRAWEQGELEDTIAAGDYWQWSSKWMTLRGAQDLLGKILGLRKWKNTFRKYTGFVDKKKWVTKTRAWFCLRKTARISKQKWGPWKRASGLEGIIWDWFGNQMTFYLRGCNISQLKLTSFWDTEQVS